MKLEKKIFKSDMKASVFYFVKIKLVNNFLSVFGLQILYSRETSGSGIFLKIFIIVFIIFYQKLIIFQLFANVIKFTKNKVDLVKLLSISELFYILHL